MSVLTRLCALLLVSAGLFLGQARAQDGTFDGTVSATTVLAALEQQTTTAVARAEDSVVAIARINKNRSLGDRSQLPVLGSRFPSGIDDAVTSIDFVPSFFGSGVIIDADGYIVTCAHVIDDPTKFDYVVWLGKRAHYASVVSPLPTRVLASDPFSDLAVLKIEQSNLKAIEFADPGTVRKGMFVLALGNPDAIARDGSASASWGIVSNLQRLAPASNDADGSDSIHEYGTLIQTDARLNLGASGGALINLQGQMIGLTTALAARGGAEHAAGFAIATDQLFQRVVETLKLGKLPEFGFLGIQPENLRPSELRQGLLGARVAAVLPGLPGEEAGLLHDDIITMVNDQHVFSRKDLFRELSAVEPGTDVRLGVLRSRAGQSFSESIRLVARVSKRPTTNSNPGYASQGHVAWRGMKVDYLTALPAELSRSSLWSGRRRNAQIAVAAVEPDSPAWQAGIRPGDRIVACHRKTVSSPADFYAEAEKHFDDVQVDISRVDGSQGRIIVPSPNR